MRWVVTVAAVLLAREAWAGDAIGGTAGITLGPSEYFPAFLVGVKAGSRSTDCGALLDRSRGTRSAVHASRRRRLRQLGSSRRCERGTPGPWILGRRSAPNEPVPRRTRGSRGRRAHTVQQQRYCRTNRRLHPRRLDGADLQLDNPISRVALSFDMPSFTTHDDIVGPVGELSIVISAALR